MARPDGCCGTCSPLADSERTFDAYLKYLRREGLPFAPEEMGVGRGNLLRYRYVHLMEMAVALYLRSQAILPTDVVRVLAGLRAELRPIYERAYIEGRCGLGRAGEGLGRRRSSW